MVILDDTMHDNIFVYLKKLTLQNRAEYLTLADPRGH